MWRIEIPSVNSTSVFVTIVCIVGEYALLVYTSGDSSSIFLHSTV